MSTQPNWQPDKVLLFSGHRIDAPNRTPPRFPPEKAAVADARLNEALDRIGVGTQSLALSQAAAGGDILFVEACHARGARCQVLLPFAEAEFLQQSVASSADGAHWVQRFHALKAQLGAGAFRIMPEELGPLPQGADPYERCNLWLLSEALAYGDDKLHFVCIWNGATGDGPGGTAHMAEEAKRRTGRIYWIDTRTL